MEQPLKWLFDGLGGAALIGVIGFLYHKLRSRKDLPPGPSTTAESSDVAADKSVVVGTRSTMQTSPVVYGSHNSINIAHHTQESKDAAVRGESGDKELSRKEVLGIFLGIPAFFCASLWVLFHFGTVRGALEGNRTASAIGFQYGSGISAGNGVLGDQATSCTADGTVCLGEDALSGKVISIPEGGGGNWSRIAVFVNYSEGGDASKVLVSTSSNDIGLNYADHRDGNFNKQVEFRIDEPKAISETQKSYWFPVDIVYRETGIRFAITVTVEEDHRHPHAATATFEIPRKQALPEGAPKFHASGKTNSVPHGSQRIAIADRVTAIIAGLRNVSIEKVKPEDDFEIDLGASPSEVSLIIGELEEEYGISIPKADALKIRTVGEAIHYIEVRVGHK